MYNYVFLAGCPRDHIEEVSMVSMDRRHQGAFNVYYFKEKYACIEA